MKTIISPPSFPDAVEASITSGNITIPILLRRVPCMEFNLIKFGNEGRSGGLDILITVNEAKKESTFSITRINDVVLSDHLRREELILNMAQTHSIRIEIGTQTILESRIADKDLGSSIFNTAPLLSQYIKNLLLIEKHTGCSFETDIKEINVDEYNAVQMLALSLENKWFITKGKYDIIRADCDHIDETVLDDSDEHLYSSEAGEATIMVQGRVFKIKKTKAVFKNARISNLGKVKRSIQKGRKNIKIEIKPNNQEQTYTKYVILENISISTDVI